MIKRVFTSFIVFVLILSVSGCKSILEGEMSDITPYVGTNTAPADNDSAAKVSTYYEFKSAVKAMVSSYSESKTFSITEFDREDIEEALQQACQEVALEDPLGSFAVYYISCDVTPIVSYYDVKVSIVFKRDREEIKNLSTVYSDRYLQSVLMSVISQYDESYVFRTSLNSITADFIISTVREQYYKSPLNVVSQPSVEVSMYPANEGERIVEINISYGFSKNVLSSMTVRMDEAAQGIAEYATGSDDFDFLISLCEKLASSASYTVQPVSDLSNTAYGALVSRLATSEGFAMAYKALCDKMGIECIVVNGKHLGDEHFWNIVTFSGSSYHVDVTDYLANNTFLKSDESMRDNYWWDTSTVPACSSDYVHASAAAAYSSN